MKKKFELRSNSKIGLLLIFLFFSFISYSCLTYHEWNLAYFESLKYGQWDEAEKLLEKNKFLKKHRNRLLAYLESGRLQFLKGNSELSITALDSADLIVEDFKRSVTNEALAFITNDEKRPYKAERFESILIHHYKALDYYALGKMDDALVEVRRINIKLQALEDKKVDKAYNSEPFAMNVEGILYEASGDYNNAFIAYRNAINEYLETKGEHFGTPMPRNLIQDALRMAVYLSFKNEKSEIEKKTGQKYQVEKEPKGGYGLIFIETGMAPIKDQTYFTYIATTNNRGLAFFYCEALDMSIPIPLDIGVRKGEVISIAFPKYYVQGSFFNKIDVSNANQKSYTPELVANITVLAKQSLANRMHREIGKAVLRLAVKKVAQYSVQNENEGLGVAIQAFNILTEKADTRSWQTLPDRIYYQRVPLKIGENTFKVKLSNDLADMEYTVKMTGMKNGRLQIQTVANLTANRNR